MSTFGAQPLMHVVAKTHQPPARRRTSAQTKSGGEIVATTSPMAIGRKAVRQALVKLGTVESPASLTVYWPPYHASVEICDSQSWTLLACSFSDCANHAVLGACI